MNNSDKAFLKYIEELITEHGDNEPEHIVVKRAIEESFKDIVDIDDVDFVADILYSKYCNLHPERLT
jgi:hypothetical protein